MSEGGYLNDIQEVIERARQAIQDDQNHNLSPYYRLLIYSLLGPHDDEKTRLRRGKLADMAVAKVLPIWEGEWPTDRRPHNLLANAEDVLAGRVPIEEGRLKADAAFDEMAEWMQALDVTNDNKVVVAASNVLPASVECLFEASGVSTLGTMNPASTEADLDPWTTDTAGWAASAYSGPWYEPSSDSGRRQEFWIWWLDEAVPLALNA